MVVVAQLVRALDCGSRGRRFEPGLPPKNTKLLRNEKLFLFRVFCRNDFNKKNALLIRRSFNNVVILLL